MFSTMWTGTRMVLAWSAIARVCLAYPPRGIRAELEAPGVVVLLHPADQAEVAFLDQVQKEHAPPHVALRDADHQPEVRLRELVLGLEAVSLERLEGFPLVF